MPEHDVPRMLTVGELAKRLRCGRTKAYRLCHELGFPAVRIGGLLRVDAVELERWLAERRVKGTAQG